MNILILGCGRVGARIANALEGENRVTIIDWRESAFERLSSSFSGETVIGNGIDVDVLRQAGVAEADLFLALTDGDNRNLMAAQIAAYLGVPRVIARVYDPVRSEIFGQMGLTTVSPTIKGAERLFTMAVGGAEER